MRLELFQTAVSAIVRLKFKKSKKKKKLQETVKGEVRMILCILYLLTCSYAVVSGLESMWCFRHGR